MLLHIFKFLKFDNKYIINILQFLGLDPREWLFNQAQNNSLNNFARFLVIEAPPKSIHPYNLSMEFQKQPSIKMDHTFINESASAYFNKWA